MTMPFERTRALVADNKVLSSNRCQSQRDFALEGQIPKPKLFR
jgi:hypothetical protein